MMNSFFPNQDLKRLIASAKHGSKSSLSEICHRLLPAIENLCKLNFPDCLKAKAGESDLVQESMLGVSENIATLQGSDESDLLAWVQAIVENKARDFRRRFLQAEKRNIARERALSRERSSHFAMQLQDSTVTPLEKLISAERAELIQKLVSELPPHYREIVHLRHREGLTFPEIATRLGRTEPAVKNIYVRVVDTLERQSKGG